MTGLYPIIRRKRFPLVAASQVAAATPAEAKPEARAEAVAAEPELPAAAAGPSVAVAKVNSKKAKKRDGQAS